jgi:hypothetical protein
MRFGKTQQLTGVLEAIFDGVSLRRRVTEAASTMNDYEVLPIRFLYFVCKAVNHVGVCFEFLAFVRDN